MHCTPEPGFGHSDFAIVIVALSAKFAVAAANDAPIGSADAHKTISTVATGVVGCGDRRRQRWRCFSTVLLR